MYPSSLTRTALTVLNAHSAGAAIDPEDLLRLRAAAGPASAGWQADILATHVLTLELQRAARGNRASAGE